MPSLFTRIAQAANGAGEVVARTAANAQEVLSDGDLRRETGGKLVRGIQNGLHGIGSTADSVRRTVLHTVNDGLTTGTRGALGVVDRVQDQLQNQRLKRALTQSRDQPVDVQIGFTVYLDVPQEMRSRLWLVLIQQPALAVPFQELGRFPDLGTHTAGTRRNEAAPVSQGGSFKSAETVSPTPGSPGTPWSSMPSSLRHGGDAASSAPDSATARKASNTGAIELASTSALPAASEQPTVAERHVSHANAQPDNQPDAAVPSGAGAAEASELSPTADISDVCSDDTAPAPQQEVQQDILRGGELSPGGSSPTFQQGSGSHGNDSDWEVVEKADTLRGGAQSFVGPAFAHSSRAEPADPLDTSTPTQADACSMHSTATPAALQQRQPQASAAISEEASTSQPGSSRGSRGRVLNDAARRRKEAQEAAALKMQVAEENIKDAIITVQWPFKERNAAHSKYETLLQMTLGQEETEEDIMRDIRRTFPQHPRFVLDQGQSELFNVLKAYSMFDMEVGYCQGMGFIAGLLLMYLPAPLAFEVFVHLLTPAGCNMRRLYLAGLTHLKHTMAMFDWLLQRHHPKLAAHLQAHCVPSVLYLSQWLLTAFACPFPSYFTAQLVDIMLTESSDRIILQTSMAIMAEVEERLLRLSDFEDIITCLKSDPAQWSDDKLRGVLTAAYLSSVSEQEIQLASESVTADAADAAFADAAPELTQHLAASAGGESDGDPLSVDNATEQDHQANACAPGTDESAQLAHDADAPAASPAPPAHAGSAGPSPGKPPRASGGHLHRPSHGAGPSLGLDQLVRSELTQLTWTEAAGDGSQPQAHDTHNIPQGMGEQAMKDTLGRRSVGLSRAHTVRTSEGLPSSQASGPAKPAPQHAQRASLPLAAEEEPLLKAESSGAVQASAPPAKDAS